jgi:hypothetical protein
MACGWWDRCRLHAAAPARAMRIMHHAIIDKGTTDCKPISSPVCRALVAMMKIAVTIVTASLSAVIGTLIVNLVHD